MGNPWPHATASKSHIRALLAATLTLGGFVLPGAAADNDGDETPFTVAKVFVQLNDTDGDLGFRARIDGDPWKKVKIEDPNGRVILNITPKGRLRKQGVTELAFESAEPQFDELTPEAFFERFPAGDYEIEGGLLGGGEMESTVAFSHVVPAAPNLLAPAPLGCETPVVVPSGPVTVSWDPVTTSHPDIGEFDANIEVVRYEVTIEREEPEPTLRFDIQLPAEVTVLEIPGAFLALGTLFKVQVLVVEARGNETSAERCFEVSG